MPTEQIHFIKTPSERNPRSQNPISIYADQNSDLHRTHTDQDSIGTHLISFRRSKPHLSPPKIKTYLATPISTHD